MLAELLPGEPEVHGLVALMELQASRAARADRARRASRAAARPGPLALGLAARRPRAGGARARLRDRRRRSARTRCRPRSPPATRAPASREDTDWERIVALYDGLAQLDAVAGGRAQPRRRGRDGVRPAGGARARRRPRWRSRPSTATTCCRRVRGDLLEKLGRRGEARAEFERAALLTANTRQRAALLERAADLRDRFGARRVVSPSSPLHKGGCDVLRDAP